MAVITENKIDFEALSDEELRQFLHQAKATLRQRRSASASRQSFRGDTKKAKRSETEAQDAETLAEEAKEKEGEEDETTEEPRGNGKKHHKHHGFGARHHKGHRHHDDDAYYGRGFGGYEGFPPQGFEFGMRGGPRHHRGFGRPEAFGGPHAAGLGFGGPSGHHHRHHRFGGFGAPPPPPPPHPHSFMFCDVDPAAAGASAGYREPRHHGRGFGRRGGFYHGAGMFSGHCGRPSPPPAPFPLSREEFIANMRAAAAASGRPGRGGPWGYGRHGGRGYRRYADEEGAGAYSGAEDEEARAAPPAQDAGVVSDASDFEVLDDKFASDSSTGSEFEDEKYEKY